MIPVAVALMTPIPLLIAFIIKKCFGKKTEIPVNQDPATESMLNDKENEVIPPDSGNENKQVWILPIRLVLFVIIMLVNLLIF